MRCASDCWVYPVSMANEIAELEAFATQAEAPGLKVQKAQVSLDESQDGEPVTRITLLVNDPGLGEETWNFDSVRELKRELARKATELDLPSTSVTLVPKSEAGLVEAFVQELGCPDAAKISRMGSTQTLSSFGSRPCLTTRSNPRSCSKQQSA